MVEALERLSSFVWGPPMLVLLVGTHLFLTVRLRFIQRYLGTAIRLSLAARTRARATSRQFGALTTALAATIGTGNIVGVATAVAAGGPGAVLWMWLTGVFGIATKYAEALLSVKYRVTHAGRRRWPAGRCTCSSAAWAAPRSGIALRRAHRGQRVRHRQHGAGQLDRVAGRTSTLGVPPWITGVRHDGAHRRW